MKIRRRFCYVTDQYNLVDIECVYIYICMYIHKDILKSILCYLLCEKRII